jgi:hypothetical protein
MPRTIVSRTDQGREWSPGRLHRHSAKVLAPRRQRQFDAATDRRSLMHFGFQPVPLRKRKSAFNHSDFIFEVKWDGFRALAVIEHGRTQSFQPPNSSSCPRTDSPLGIVSYSSFSLQNTWPVDERLIIAQTGIPFCQSISIILPRVSNKNVAAIA